MRRFFLRLLDSCRSERRERELSRELASHLELVEDDFVRRGLSVERARVEARRAIGSTALTADLHRDARSFAWIDDARRDARHAIRALRRAPAFTSVAAGPAQFKACGQIGIPGNQGISSGHADEYVWKLAGQYFVLDGGDGQPVIPPGQYLLRITVNPGFVPQPGENVAFATIDPATGLYHMLPESNYADNVAEVLVTIPDHPGKQSVGPLANTPDANAIASDDDEHSPPNK